MTLNNRVYYSLILFVFLFASCQQADQLVLVEDSNSDYQIIVSKTYDDNNAKAAAEFQKYVERVSGYRMEIQTDDIPASEKEILIGSSDRTSDLVDVSDLDEDGFIIKVINDKLIIAGGKEKGTLYGVYTFLEDYLGCRKYSAEVTIVPQKETISIDQIDIKQEPYFSFRELHMPHPRWDPSFRDWHKLDYKEGKNEWGMFVHTFDDFIPADKYFKSNPEYFSFLNVQTNS